MFPILISSSIMALAFGSLLLVLRREAPSLSRAAGWALAMAPGVGYGVCSLAFFFWVSWGSSPPGRMTMMALMVLFAGTLFLVSARYQPTADTLREISSSRRLGLRSSSVPPSELVIHSLAAIAALLTLAFVLWTYSQVVSVQPYGGWDAKAIWNVRALFLFRLPEDIGGVISELKAGHPDYPLLLPAAIAGQFCLLGVEDLAIPQITGLVFTLAAGVAVFVAVRRSSSFAVAAVCLSIYWVTPSVLRWGFVQYADIPLSYFLLMATAILSNQLERAAPHRLPPVLAGLFVGLLAWTKNEGLIQALLLSAGFLVLFLKTWGFNRRSCNQLLAIATGAGPALLALAVFKLSWSPVNETARFLAGSMDKVSDLDRWTTIGSAFWRELSPWHGVEGWGLLWTALLLAGIVLFPRRRALGRPQQLFAATLLLAFGLTILAYVMTPDPLQWHLQTSLRRLLLQLAPLAIATAVAGLQTRASSDFN